MAFGTVRMRPCWSAGAFALVFASLPARVTSKRPSIAVGADPTRPAAPATAAPPRWIMIVPACGPPYQPPGRSGRGIHPLFIGVSEYLRIVYAGRRNFAGRPRAETASKPVDRGRKRQAMGRFM